MEPKTILRKLSVPVGMVVAVLILNSCNVPVSDPELPAPTVTKPTEAEPAEPTPTFPEVNINQLSAAESN